MDCAADLPTLTGDRVLLAQALLNLLRNAIDAMRDGDAANQVVGLIIRRAGDGIEVSVTDRGPGIPPETADKLFDPFFTTKSEGMGMGLNITRSIIESHHGRLWFDANPGGGSIFTFALPGSRS